MIPFYFSSIQSTVGKEDTVAFVFRIARVQIVINKGLSTCDSENFSAKAKTVEVGRGTGISFREFGEHNELGILTVLDDCRHDIHEVEPFPLLQDDVALHDKLVQGLVFADIEWGTVWTGQTRIFFLVNVSNLRIDDRHLQLLLGYLDCATLCLWLLFVEKEYV